MAYLDGAVQDFHESGEERIDEMALLDNLNLLLVTGHESAAITISWLISELLQHPKVLERVQEEVDALPEVVTDASALPPTPHLDMAILETFRLHPPIPVATRSSVETFTLGGYTVPEGTTILPCIFLAHRDPELWEDSEAFRPERFVDGKSYPNLFFPFGGGSHRCPGSDMGIMQVKFITAAILKRFTVSYRGTRPPRSKYFVATVIPGNKMPISVEARPATSRETGSLDRSDSISCPMHAETDQPATCPHES
jgi:cytochrome P450